MEMAMAFCYWVSAALVCSAAVKLQARSRAHCSFKTGFKIQTLPRAV